MSSNTVSNELPNGQVKTIDISNQDKNATTMHSSSTQTKQDPIDKSLTSQEKNNPDQNHDKTLNSQSENPDQTSQKDQSDKTPSSPSKEELQPSNTDSSNSFDVDGSKSGRNNLGHSKKQGSREFHSSWKSRNSVQQTKQPKNKRKDDIKPEPLQDLNSWPSLEQARSTETVSKKANESITPKSPKAAPFQSGEEKQDEAEIQSTKKKGINWIPFKEALAPVSVSSSGSISPPSTAPNSSQSSGNPREGRSGSNPANRGPRGNRRRSDKDNSDEFYQRQPREGQQSQGGNSQGGRNWRGQYRNSGNRGYSNRQFNSGPQNFLVYTLEGEQLRDAILYQIEYYYSVENLVRDVWLRQQWDEEGWLPLSFIASFPRVRALTTDLSALSEALKLSTILEYKDDKIRKLEDWKNWVLPKTGATVDSPITSPKSNEQNIPVSNSVTSDSNSSNIITSTSSTESSENSPQSTSNASQNQPTTRTYASLASADTSAKQKLTNNKPQRKQEAPKKAATAPPSSQTNSASQSQRQKSEQLKSENKVEQKSELKKSDSATSTPSETKKENTTESKPTTEEGEWQTVEAKKRRSMQKVPSGRGSKDLPKKSEETNGVGDENHIVSPNTVKKEKTTQ